MTAQIRMARRCGWCNAQLLNVGAKEVKDFDGRIVVVHTMCVKLAQQYFKPWTACPRQS